MIAAMTVLVVVALSLLVTRVATVALTLTGLSRETARFQARSALTGAGFTTTESEQVVNHPVRRRIVMALMLIGSAGVVTVVGTTALALATARTGAQVGSRTLILLVGLVGLVWLAQSRGFDRALQPLIRRLLRRYTDIDVRDYASLLQVHGDYAVSELAVEPGDWLAGKRLEDLRLGDEGMLVLGIIRGDEDNYVGAPRGDDVLRAGDTAVIYGPGRRLADLDARPSGPSGDAAHVAAVEDERASGGGA